MVQIADQMVQFFDCEYSRGCHPLLAPSHLVALNKAKIANSEGMLKICKIWEAVRKKKN